MRGGREALDLARGRAALLPQPLSREGRGEVGFFVIVDPDGLLQWLGRNRALVAIRDAADLAARGLALQALRRDWIRDAVAWLPSPLAGEGPGERGNFRKAFR